MANQERTEGTKGTNVPSQGQSDDVRRADESGEPGVAGRAHGRVIDEQGGPAGKTADATETGSGAGKHSAGAKGNTGKVGEDLESGRQGAV